MRFIGIAGLILVMAGAAQADFDLPLSIRETQGGGATHISNGVPLLPGQAMKTGELHVLDAKGKEVPSQFRVLARWWRKDDSIRWVLVDFIGSVPTGTVSTYKLVGRKGRAPRPATPMKVTADENFIRINTGPALYEIDRKRFNLINKLQIDKNADGTFAASETVVHPDPKLGSVVEDPKGRKYYSSKGTRFVKFIDRGPVRVTILAKGNHVSTEQGAFKPALYGYEVFMTFHADRPYVDIDAVLTNNFAKPIGEPHIEDWSILTNVGGPKIGGAGCNLWAKGYANVGVPAGGSVVLYQDSLGTRDWAGLPGFEPRTGGLQSFRGYKIWQAAGGKKKEVGAGDFASGFGQFGRSSLGCVLAPKDFWQQFPSAIEYMSDGTLRYSMFPREYRQVHWLEDGSAVGQEFRLHFYIKMASRRYTAFSGNHRPWSHVVYDSFLSRPWALPSVEHCGRAGALSDIGPYLVNERMPIFDFPLARRARRAMMTDYLKGNGYGWQAFGTRWEELAGHSPWNYEPIWTSASLFNYLVTRRPNWRTYGLRVARQARDVRAYLIDDQDNLKVWFEGRGGGYQRNSIFESFSRRTPNTGAHPYRRQRWPLPNQEHLNLDEVYDLYLMTGDDRARRCMEMIACHGAFTASRMRHYARPSRSEGWCMRTLMRYYDLTGDRRFKPHVDAAIDKLWREVNRAGTQGGTWLGGVFARGVIAGYLATGDERLRDVAIGHADWARTYECGTNGYPYHTDTRGPYNLKPEERGGHCPWANAYLIDPHAFAYEQTGNPVYLKAMDFAWQKLNPQAGRFTMFLPMALYRTRPRADKVPPAAVTDLKGRALGGGKVRLTWTAPGDDGKRGRAAVYQIKYAAKPIMEFVPWPDKKDTHVAFWGAEKVPDEPAPKAAGTKEAYTAKGIAAGTYYFAIKTRDEINNQSAISNVVKLEVK